MVIMVKQKVFPVFTLMIKKLFLLLIAVSTTLMKIVPSSNPKLDFTIQQQHLHQISLLTIQQQNRAIAIGDVVIIDSDNEILADTLEHFRNTKITFAFSNVRLINLKNNSEIYGEHLEDYRQRGYSIIDIKPLFIQVDTTYIEHEDSTKETRLDTLFIKARLMEAYRDSSQRFFAIDSVSILKSEFASKNDLTIFYREEDKIITKKINESCKTAGTLARNIPANRRFNYNLSR